MNKGKFIVFEGINGCGKGTHLKRLHSYILDSGKAVPIFTTGEPNNFDHNGFLARKMLKGDGDPYSNNLEAAKYFAENRKTHNEIFVPMLEKGIDVLCDRYWHSNLAFQKAQGVSFMDIAMANVGSRVPDLTFLIDVPVEVAFDRLGKRDGENRRKFDSDKDFMEKVRRNYLELPEVLYGIFGDESLVIVDGDRPVDEVFAQVRSGYENFLGK